MRIAVLGPLEVHRDGAPRPVSGLRLQRLVLRLAVDVGRAVPATALIDAVWPDGPPGEAANALQSLVSRARRALGDAETIVPAGAGYRLAVTAEDVDLTRFAAAVVVGHDLLRSDPAGALQVLDGALALWRGPALPEAADPGWVEPVLARLAEQHAGARVDRAAALVRSGRAGEAVPVLGELVLEHPLREPYVVALMAALDAAGRPADALGAYDALRQRLADELGSDPGPEARAEHLRLLRAPTPTSPRTRRDNLRAAGTPLIGRGPELQRARELLGGGRLVTMIGPGGAGKTRLAIEVARDQLDRFPDGVWLVELAAIGDPGDVAQALLGALGGRAAALLERQADRVGGRDALTSALSALREASCLLVVDNCEHLVAAVADLVDAVLGECPGVRVLATSREPLAVAGEALCVVPPLPMPAEGVAAGPALDYPAVRLLAERAAAVSASFRVDETTVADVVQIVRRLDGMPLAIELAAARLRVLPVAEVARRLSDRFRLLSGGPRTALPRHRTLRAVVEWSWDLLAEDERRLLERLGVFAAGADTDAAVAVCADGRLPATDVGELLLALADKSLVQVVPGPRARFRLLETIREFALERLVEQGEVVAWRAAHAGWVLGEVQRWDAELRGGDQSLALQRLGELAEETAVAVRHLADAGDEDGALRLVVGLSWFWTITGADDQAAVLLDAVLAATTGSAHPMRPYAEMAALASGTGPAGDAGDPGGIQGPIRAVLDRMLTGPAPSEACAVIRAWAAVFAGDGARAERMLSDGYGLDTPWGQAARHAMRAAMAENAGEIRRMRAEVEQAVTAFTAIGDRWGLSAMLANRAVLRTYDGDLDGAEADLVAAGADVTRFGTPEDEALIALRRADLRLRRGDVDGARAIVAASRAQVGHRPRRFVDLIIDISELGVAVATGRLAEAVALEARMRTRLADTGLDPVVRGRAGAIGLALAAELAARRGDVPTALRDVAEAVAQSGTTGDLPVSAAVAGSVAVVAACAGDPAAAARVLGRADVLRGVPDPTDVRTSALWAQLVAADPDGAGRARDVGRAESRVAALAHLEPQRW